MCTVSFIRVNDTVIITSNRDEHRQRKNAAAPAFHVLQDKKIIFPKDAKAGGTWFAAADNGTVAVLLNGAFVKHVAGPPYRKSRGLILLDLIGNPDPLSCFAGMNLDNIEPFTLILFQSGSLHELRWDEKNKYEKRLDAYTNFIWSSATLYSEEVVAHRKMLFDRFIGSGKIITPQLAHRFHSYNHGDPENGFVINRLNGIKTFSITQAVVQPASINFLHNDLIQMQQFEETMAIHQATTHS